MHLEEQGGGAGNPGGLGMIDVSQTTSLSGSNGTGGLLIIYSDIFTNNSIIESNGSIGGNGYNYGGQGGSSGGGSINIFYNTLNNSKLKPTSSGGTSNSQGGAGGNGTVTIGSISSGSFTQDN